MHADEESVVDSTARSPAPRTDAVAPRILLPLRAGSAELLTAVSEWVSARWPINGAQLWAQDARGFHMQALFGRPSDDADRQLALRSGIESGCVRTPQRLAIPLSRPGDADCVLLFASTRGFPVQADAACFEAAAALEQRLPAALEVERLQRTLAQISEAERLQRALFEIADLASADHDIEEVFPALHGIIGRLMYAENFFIALLDRDRYAIHFPYFKDSVDAHAPLPTEVFPVADMKGSLAAHVIATGDSLMGPSEALIVQVGAQRTSFGPESVDWLGVPLSTGAEVLGVIAVQSYDERQRYSEKDRSLLTFVAQHVATALLRIRAVDELERRVAERTDELREANRALRLEVDERQRGEQLQSALFRIAELGSAAGSLDDFYAAVHRVVGRLLYAENFYVAMLSEDGDELYFPYSVDEFDPPRPRRRLARGLTEYVLRTGKAVLVDRKLSNALHAAGEISSYGTRSACWLGVPLICDSGAVGVLAVQSYDELHSFSRRDQEILTFVGIHIANALERKHAAERLVFVNADLERRVVERTEAMNAANRDLLGQIEERERFERQLQFAATHDALTALPNRANFLSHLAEALHRFHRRHRNRFAVLFLDLDRFKVINDSVGHLVGDELLKEVGARISSVVDAAGMVARLGGDEFAVLVDPLPNEAFAVELAERIIAALDEPIRVSGKELFTSTSVGIAVAQPLYANPEDLLRDADAALYRAKSKGRRCHELFDEELRRQALHALEMEGNLRRALARNEFEPLFQPIHRLQDGAVVGYEALMRWRHPQRGLLSPMEFLTTAEDTGLAEAMDWQIFEQVFAQGWRLAEIGHYVTINVGGRHFRNPGFVEQLLHTLARHAFSTALLRVEVTERVLLEEPEKVQEMMEALCAAGIRLALDDFGTGYSSLSYLHQFPLNALKIDRSFVLALDAPTRSSAHAVLRAICTLGQSLGMDVIAEGIETQKQCDTVQDYGCGFGQGYLFSPPRSLQELLSGD